MQSAIKGVDDLTRALDSENAPNESRRRYIVDRARALGRTDLLPKAFVERHTKTQSDQIYELAVSSGIDVYRLRCVFIRGLRDGKADGLSGKQALDYANRRLDAFVSAATADTALSTGDVDLLPR